MNVMHLLAIAVSVLGFAAAEAQIKPHNCVSKKCTRELEAIVYQPETYYRKYLDKISEEIKIQGPFILWTNQANSYIDTFEAKYNVQVIIENPFRRSVLIKFATSSTYYRTTSVANLNGSGYNYSSKDEMAMLEFIVFNSNGELKYVMINLPFGQKG